jgi:hypothetical protein
LTARVHRPSIALHLDKSPPGESRGRKATGPRLLRDATPVATDATKDPKIAELPKGRSAFVLLPDDEAGRLKSA